MFQKLGGPHSGMPYHRDWDALGLENLDPSEALAYGESM